MYSYDYRTVRKLFTIRSCTAMDNLCGGNARNTFLWLDNWHPVGPLFAKYGAIVIYILGRNHNAKVASIIANQNWQWPRCRNSVTRKIIIHKAYPCFSHPSYLSRGLSGLESERRWQILYNICLECF